MESAVVTLFAQQGTPVIFLERKDLRPAITLLCEERGPQRRTRQHLLFRQPPSSERVGLWLRSKRRLSVVRVLRKLSRKLAKRFEKGDLCEKDYEALLRTLRRSNPRWQVLVGILKAMMLEFVIPLLQRAKLDPHCGVLHPAEDFGLGLDFCFVLEPEIHLQALRFFKAPNRRGHLPWFPQGEEMREIVLRFENSKENLKAHVQALIDELLELMREVGGDDLSHMLRHRRRQKAAEDL